MGLIVLCLLAVVAALLGLPVAGLRAGPLPRTAAWALALLPALLMSAVILAARGEGPAAGHRGADIPWRVTLAALRFPLVERALSIGGDADRDDLVIPGLPAGSASSFALGDGREDVTIHDAPPGARGGLLTHVQGGGGDAFGGTPLPPDAELCVSADGVRCAATSPRIHWTLKGGRALLTGSQGEACPLPPPATPRGASQVARRVFPLGAYARPGCRGRARFQWDEGEPAEELLYWKEGPPRWLAWLMFWRADVPQLYLLPVDYSRTLLIVSQGRATAVRRQAPLVHARVDTRVSVYQIIPGMGLPTREHGDDNFARLQERRSLLLRYLAPPAGPALDVFLDTPQTVTLAALAHPQLRISAQSGGPEAGTGGTQIAAFSVIGKPTAAGLVATVRYASDVAGAPARCRAGQAALLVQGVTGVSCGQAGRWFGLGDPGRVLAKVRIAPLTVPLSWVAAIWAMCLFNLLARDLLALPAPARIVLGLTEVLLVLRVLTAFEAAVVDARREDAVAGAWLALLWLPLVLELLPASGVAPLRALPVRAAKGLLAVLATVLVVTSAGMSAFSPRDWLAWLTGDMGKSALVSAALAVPAAWLLHGAPRLRALRARLTPRLAALMALLPPHIPAWLRAPLGRAALLPVLLAGLHLGAVLAGVKEQIGGVRIAAFLIPLLVLAWARWYAVLARERAALPLRWEALALFAPFLAYIPFVLAHDIGAYIYFIALAAWLSVGAWPARGRVWALWVAGAGAVAGLCLVAVATLGAVLAPLALPGLLTVLVCAVACGVLLPWREPAALRRELASLPALAVIGVLGAMQAGGAILAPRAALPAGAPTWDEVARIEGLSGNAVRLLDLLAPQAVESLGVRSAYEQRVAMAEMQAYGASLLGRGWLAIPAPDALRQTHVDDNVTAVHLLGPFGRAGGLGVGLALLAFAAAVQALSAARPAVLANRAQLGAVMLTVTSLYMLLANIAQVPFTGRNFYFLAVSSHSDLLEGGLLLVIALSAFVHRRPEAPHA